MTPEIKKIAFRCAKAGHIAKGCPQKVDKDDSGGGHVDKAMGTTVQTAVEITADSWKSNRWMLDLCCSKHMSINKSYSRNFALCKEVVNAGNNKAICSYRVATVQMITMVDGMQHHTTFRDVMYTAESMHNLISITQARKSRFMVRLEDDPRNATRGRVDLHHMPSGKIMMCGFEKRERLYEAVTSLCSNRRSSLGQNR